MSIDWITVAAQVINFLVLVWLLRRFLYRPILDGIDARENEIAERMEEAMVIRKAAEATEAKYKSEVAMLGASRSEMIDEAHRVAEKQRDALLAETRERLAAEQALYEAQRAEKTRRHAADLHRIGAKALLSLTRKALSDLSDETLEQRIVAHAAERLVSLADDMRDAAGDDREAVVLTQAPLPKDAARRLGEELGQILPGFTLRFETDPRLAPGLTLRLGGAQVDWTVDSYLDGLDAELEAHSGPPVTKGMIHAA